MLILFDIDGTLLVSQRAGVTSMQEAGRELFGDSFVFEGIDFTGRLDPWIWGELAKHNGIDRAQERHAQFRATYARHLAERLAANPTAKALPGVIPLVDALRQCEDVTLGLLTGNYPETGRLKVNAAGIDPDFFLDNAWGDDGPTRRDLPPVAMRRHHLRTGRVIEPERVVIIGDTPLDVDCALAHGCRVLAVGTGGFALDVLRTAGAHQAVNDLSDTRSILEWMLEAGPQPASGPGARSSRE